MDLMKHSAAVAGESAGQKNVGRTRRQRAPRVAPQERHRSTSTGSLRELLAFLVTGGEEGHARNRYRL